jgi:hypothetical protein
MGAIRNLSLLILTIFSFEAHAQVPSDSIGPGINYEPETYFGGSSSGAVSATGGGSTVATGTSFSNGTGTATASYPSVSASQLTISYPPAAGADFNSSPTWCFNILCAGFSAASGGP